MSLRHFAFFLVLATALAAPSDNVSTTYTAYRFEAVEGWRVQGSGNVGASAITGNKLIADFSKGAKWIAVAPPDRVLLGNVDRLRFRIRGNAKGHPVQVLLRTHFMNFQKTAGEFSGDGEQELVIDGPPGPGWKWFSGENDGKLHGPIRIGELRFDSSGHADRVEIELLSIISDGNAPANRRTVLTAESVAPGGRPLFRTNVRSMMAESAAGTLRWKFRDWSGKELGANQKRITTRPAGEPLVVDIEGPAVPATLKFVEAEVDLDVEGQETPGVKPCWLAAMEPQRDARLSPESPFGMGIYLGRYQGADMDRVAEAARDAGVKWSREGLAWSRIEPEKGRFQWEYFDRLVATAKRNGISIYALLHGWSSWSKAYTPEGVDDYVAYARQVVRRYKNDIHHWEIWNEPNIFFWDGPKDLYATLLTKAYAAIKREDPSAQVLGMSTAGIDYNFIARTMARGGPYDALTIHPYRKEFDDQIFINELKIVSDLAGGKPVWITEMGWAVHTPHNTRNQDFAPNSLRTQAELIARTYLCTLVSGVRPNTSWYDFRNDGEDPIYFEHNMGILYRDYRPKPAYVAFSTMTRVLKDLRPTAVIEAGKDIFAYRFEGARTVVVLWSPNADATAGLALGASKAELINTIGETREITGQFSVPLKKGAPVYVVYR